MPTFKITIYHHDRLVLGDVRLPGLRLIPVWTEQPDGEFYHFWTESSDLFEAWCAKLRVARRWFEASQ
jgi:hypothetical protein